MKQYRKISSRIRIRILFLGRIWIRIRNIFSRIRNTDQYFYQEVQQTVAEKTSALESEAFKTKRMQEETAILKRKVRMYVIISAV